MKKIFIEPQMKRIELNLKENIAASGDKVPIDSTTSIVLYMRSLSENTCMVIDKMLKKDITDDNLGTLSGCYHLNFHMEGTQSDTAMVTVCV